MKFKIYNEVFLELPDLYFGVVIGNNIDNNRYMPEICTLLEREMGQLEDRLKGINIKEYPDLKLYRDAFNRVGLNPNKYTSSIEAMVKRVAKGNRLPSINPIVDLGNSVSLKYILPMGAHDLDALKGEIAVRFSKEGDTFIPLGEETIETLEAGELVYADVKRIRTRRWIWRQSDIGKIDENSKNIFFPIDGFEANKDKVVQAADELEALLRKYFQCQTKKGFININNKEMEI